MTDILGDTVVHAAVPAQTIDVHATDPGRQVQSHDPSVPATTTFQEDLVSAGQRRINLIWEYTQSVISIMVVTANMIVAVYDGMQATAPTREFPVVLSSALFLIVGFYFSRTNHGAIGGVGQKPDQGVYSGR